MKITNICVALLVVRIEIPGKAIACEGVILVEVAKK